MPWLYEAGSTVFSSPTARVEPTAPSTRRRSSPPPFASPGQRASAPVRLLPRPMPSRHDDPAACAIHPVQSVHDPSIIWNFIQCRSTRPGRSPIHYRNPRRPAFFALHRHDAGRQPRQTRRWQRHCTPCHRSASHQWIQRLTIHPSRVNFYLRNAGLAGLANAVTRLAARNRRFTRSAADSQRCAGADHSRGRTAM